MGKITITAKRDGFRRCGVAHKDSPVIWPEGSFTADQIAVLKAEPMLVVYDGAQVSQGALEEQLLKLQIANSGLHEKAEKLAGEISSLQSNLTTLTADKEALQASVDALTGEKSTLQASVETLTSEKDALQKQVIELSAGGKSK